MTTELSNDSQQTNMNLEWNLKYAYKKHNGTTIMHFLPFKILQTWTERKSTQRIRFQYPFQGRISSTHRRHQSTRCDLYVAKTFKCLQEERHDNHFDGGNQRQKKELIGVDNTQN